MSFMRGWDIKEVITLTINTLSYVHSLLIKEEDNTKKKAEWLREIYYAAEIAYEEGKCTKADLESKKQQYEKMRDDNMTAYHALRDFEAQEW